MADNRLFNSSALGALEDYSFVHLAVAINYVYTQRHGYRFTMIDVTKGRRPASWSQVAAARHFLRTRPRRDWCEWMLLLDSDSFVRQNERDALQVIRSTDLWQLCAKGDRCNDTAAIVPGTHTPRHISHPEDWRALQLSHGARAGARADDVALIVAAERVIPGVVPTICTRCVVNAGVLWVQPAHPETQRLLDDWWRAPLEGVCSLSDFWWEQDCLNNLLWHNQTSADRRPSLRRSVAVADFTAFNTPAGQFVMHPWGKQNRQRKALRKRSFMYAAVQAGITNERVMEHLLRQIADRHTIRIPGLLAV